MIDIQEFFRGFSIISFLLYPLQGLKKAINCMAISLTSPTPPLPPPPSSSSSSSSSSPPCTPPSWLSCFFSERGATHASDNQTALNSKNQAVGGSKEYDSARFKEDDVLRDNMFSQVEREILHEKYTPESTCGLLTTGGSDSSRVVKVGEVKGITGLRKRPARLVVPEYYPRLELGEMDNKTESKELEVEGRDYYLASKKGRREFMEDGYGVLLDILGDPKQAFFSVIDGHGGRAATDYVAKYLGKNIVKALEFVGEEENQSEAAIHGGYLATDKEFLSQGVNGGACAASVLFRDGHLHVANVGDCRVVLSRKGVADVLTRDHRLSSEDERSRIEGSGGYVHCRNGVWRVNGSLAVSRAIGDLHLKQWVISEPEIKKFPLTSDCEFLIMASDGLWDKVNDQEAVDVVLKGNNSQDSCKKLVDMSCRRGNMDDITVMVINVQEFVATSG